VSTSAHYISQIEQQNKFPSPEMLERIAAALDIDSPQLFSMTSFTNEALKQFQQIIIADLGTAAAQIVTARSTTLKMT
jgi:transcriptional regulator with XRE-family HTH domain